VDGRPWALIWNSSVRRQPGSGRPASILPEQPAAVSVAAGIRETRSRGRTSCDIAVLLLLTLSYAAVGYFQYLLLLFGTHYYFRRSPANVGEEKSRKYATIVKPRHGCRHGRAAAFFQIVFPAPAWGLRLGPVARVDWRNAGCRGNFLGAWSTNARRRAPSYFGFSPWPWVSLGMSEGPFWATAIWNWGGARGATAAGLVNTRWETLAA